MSNLRPGLKRRTDGEPAVPDRRGAAGGDAPAARWRDDVDGSIEPTRGTFLARRLALVAVMVVLVALGAAGGRFLPVGRSPMAESSDSEPAPQRLAPPATGSAATTPGSEAATVGPSATEPAPTVDDLLEGTSRLVPLAPERVLDTGDGPTVGRRYRVDLAGDWAAVALSVTVAGPPGGGSVVLDGGAGAVEGVTLGRPDQTTTNLIVVPMTGRDLTAWSTAGGRIAIDLVGGFEASGAAKAGRFVATEPIEVGRLVTGEDGRETVLSYAEALPVDRAGAVLVAIEADVGTEGGMVRLGSGLQDYDQALAWGPSGTGSRQRRGLALVRPNESGETHVRYEGGSELSAHVVGYFTNGSQPASTAGLFLPAGPQRLYEGRLGPDDAAVVDDLEPAASTALVTVESPAMESGRLGSFLVPVANGRITLTSPTEVDAVVTLLGLFLGEGRGWPAAPVDG